MRTKSAFLISSAAIFTLGIRAITNFLIIRVFIETFGNEMNGLIATSRQLLEYLNIIDAGVGVAIIAMLFKPLANNDYEQINKIVNTAIQYYKKIGIFFFVLLFFISIIFSNIANQEIDSTTIFWVMMLAGASNFSNFFVMAGYNYLLIANQREYVIHLSSLFSFFAGPVLMIILMKLDYNIYVVRVVPIFMNLIAGFVVRSYALKQYSWLKIDSKNTIKIGSQAKDTIIHQIAGLIVFNTDMIVLSIFLGFEEVSIYSVYLSIFFIAKNLLAPLIASGRVGIGEILAEGNLRKVNSVFSTYEYISFFVIFLILTTLSIVTIPFVNIYANGLNDLQYVDSKLCLLFVLVFLFDMIRNPHQAVINVAGHFKQTKFRSLFEAFLNIFFSLIFVNFIGMYGVLLGTLLSYMYRVIDIFFYTFHKILKTSVKRTFIRLGSNFLLAATLYFIGSSSFPEVTDVIGWLIYSTIYFLSIALVFFTFNLWIEPIPMKDFLRKIKFLNIFLKIKL